VDAIAALLDEDRPCLISEYSASNLRSSLDELHGGDESLACRDWGDVGDKSSHSLFI
jgi:hypothetical protein